MLDVNPDTVCFLISKAREFHSKEEVVIPDTPDSPAEDWGLQALTEHMADVTLQEFKTTFADLEPDQQRNVVALFWLGRGDYTARDWLYALDAARQNATPWTAEYLIAHPQLADYLLEGLAMMGYRCE